MEAALELGNEQRRKISEVPATQSQYCYEGTPRGNSGEISERAELERLLPSPQKIKITMNRMLVEIWTIKAILVSDRKEEHVIGKWRQDDSCYKVSKTWLNYVHVLAFCGR